MTNGKEKLDDTGDAAENFLTVPNRQHQRH